MTDNEILKALECCIKSSHFGECFENKCPLVSEEGCKVGKETLYPYAFDLINRQKAEIERLEKLYDQSYKESLRWKNEVERLQKLLDDKCDRCIAKDRSEAITEFENNVLELFPSDKKTTTISRFAIKQIAKEMKEKLN